MAWLLCLFCCPLLPYAQADTTQSGAENSAAGLNHQGSDNSLQNSTTNAMAAVMNVAALNIPGAMSYGYKAYGQYLNSEKMDNSEYRSQHNQIILVSVGSETAASAGPRPTTYSRLDPSFLHEGVASQVADEFEKRSGMSRELFLKHMGDAIDSGLSYDDPNLLQKLEAQYASFKGDIKNQDFRQGLEKAEAMFPESARQEVLGKLQDMYKLAWNGDQPASGSALAAAHPSSPAASAAPAPVPAVAAGNNQAPARDPASDAPAVPADLGQGKLLGLEAGNPEASLKELLGSDTAGDEESLFVKVSKRYRLLAPGLLKPAKL
jgi:hypothetical protein